MHLKTYKVPIVDLNKALERFGLILKTNPQGSCSECIINKGICRFKSSLCYLVLGDSYLACLNGDVKVDWDEVERVLESIKDMYELCE